MRAILVLALAIPISIYSQTISGVVVDVDGKPIEGVRIEHLIFAHRDIKTTDASGHFTVEPKGAAVVLRKLGYQSLFVPVSTNVPMRFVLLVAHPREFPACESRPHCYSLAGNTGFCFPQIEGVVPSRLERGIDGVAQKYLLNAGQESAKITHIAGPSSTFGNPDARSVWSSHEYSETNFTVGQITIRDARGKTAGGAGWRYLGTLGEAASYYDADAATASIFDRMLDGACWLPNPR